ncbi:hypothetical protein S245_059501 [Arachis hypogaea]
MNGAAAAFLVVCGGGGGGGLWRLRHCIWVGRCYFGGGVEVEDKRSTLLVPMESRTAKPFITTNLVVFAPINASNDCEDNNFIACGDALIVDPGYLSRFHGEIGFYLGLIWTEIVVAITSCLEVKINVEHMQLNWANFWQEYLKEGPNDPREPTDEEGRSEMGGPSEETSTSEKGIGP